MDRVLYTSFTFPFNYGFIPQTIAKDGDSLDIIILSAKSFSGLTIVPCNIIGLLKIRDSGVEDDKIIAVPIDEPEYKQINSITQIPHHIKKLIEHFYSHYKDLEGKKVKVIGWFDKAKAKQLLRKGLDSYNLIKR
jgi:inorganic pyrophosphatase